MTRTFRGSPAVFVLSTLARASLTVVAWLLLWSVVPAVIGWESTVVLSGSMAPAVEPGDVAVVAAVDPSELKPGAVLLVDDPDHPDRSRLHRLVAIEDDRLRLRGDANPAPDSSLVSVSNLHGVGELRIPWVGLPVVYVGNGQWRELALATAGLTVIVALAALYRPVPRPGARRTRRVTRRARRLAGVALVLTAAGTSGSDGAQARYSSATASPASYASNAYYSCDEAASRSSALLSYPLGDQPGTTAVNTGTAGPTDDAVVNGGVTFEAAGSGCHAAGRAVTLDGTTGYLANHTVYDNPQGITVQAWFRTTATRGKIVSFESAVTGDGGSGDRTLFIRNTGQLVFATKDFFLEQATSARAYNDGAWHLATGTLDPVHGISLFVDGVKVANTPGGRQGQVRTGYWLIGYGRGGDYSGAAADQHFTGSISGVSVYSTVLTDTVIAAHYYSGAPLQR